MPSPQPADPLIPHPVAVRLLNELNILFGQTALEICHLDVDSGALTDCTQQDTLLRKLAVVVKAQKITQLMHNSLLATAAADPKISQPKIAHALGLTQQGASYRIARLQTTQGDDLT